MYNLVKWISTRISLITVALKVTSGSECCLPVLWGPFAHSWEVLTTLVFLVFGQEYINATLLYCSQSL